MGRRLLRGLALATGLLGLSAGPAAAGGTITPLPEHVLPGIRHVAGPAFAGDAIAYAVPNGRDGFDVKVRSAAGVTSTQHVYSEAGGPIDVYYQQADALAASSDTVAFAETLATCHDESGCKYQQFEPLEAFVYAGPLGGPLEYRGCAGPMNPAVDVSGTVVAFLNGCAGGVTVRDQASSRRAPWRTFPAAFNDVRIAGRFLAVDSGADDPQKPAHTLTVYDWRTGDEVFAVQSNFGAATFDVQDDGTLAFAGVVEGGRADLSWASPEHPTPHVIARRPYPEGLRIADGKIAVRASTAFRVYSLDGAELASTPALDESAQGGFDFDGQRLAWVDQPCTVAALVEWDLEGSAPTLPSGACPAGAAAASAGVVDLKRRRVDLPLRCPAEPPLGCGGFWEARLNTKPAVSIGAWVALHPGERRTVRFKLSAKQACRVARARVTRARADTAAVFVRRSEVTPGTASFKLRYSGRARGCKKR